MVEYEDTYEDEYYDEAEEGITSEDCWTVISSFFEAKGLVSQQLDSFDEFISSTMQELVEEQGAVTLDQTLPPAEDEVDPGRRPLEFAAGAVAPLVDVFRDGCLDRTTGSWPCVPLGRHIQQVHEEVVC